MGAAVFANHLLNFFAAAGWFRAAWAAQDNPFGGGAFEFMRTMLANDLHRAAPRGLDSWI